MISTPLVSLISLPWSFLNYTSFTTLKSRFRALMSLVKRLIFDFRERTSSRYIIFVNLRYLRHFIHIY